MDAARRDTHTKNEATVIELAAINIIEATAQARLRRADKFNTGCAISLNEYKPKDFVDIWFALGHKDMNGLRGPAEFLSVKADSGKITVIIQGRTLGRQNREVRPIYLIF